MVKRWFDYIGVMFPPHINIPVGTALFFNCYALAVLLAGRTDPKLSWTFIIGALTVPLCMLLLRVMDEIKDEKVDSVLPEMKDRPVVRGIISIRDLKFLLIFLTILTTLVNAVTGIVTFFAFLIVLGYCYLMFVYFFYPAMSKNLVLTLVTHNPVSLLLGAYALSFFITSFGIREIRPLHFLLPVYFWLPFLGWEISRKVRHPESETEYVTYSRLFGLRRVCIFLAALSVLHFVLFLMLFIPLPYFTIVFLAETLLSAFIIITFARYGTVLRPGMNGFRRRFELVLAVRQVLLAVYCIALF